MYLPQVMQALCQEKDQITISKPNDMLQHLVFKCQSFESKKEYVLKNPELYSPESLAVLDAMINRSQKGSAVLLRLHRNLLSEIACRGVEEAFCDYGYVDKGISQMFFDYIADDNMAITGSTIITQGKLCALDNSTKIKLINWFVAGNPNSGDRLTYIKAGIGVN